MPIIFQIICVIYLAGSITALGVAKMMVPKHKILSWRLYAVAVYTVMSWLAVGWAIGRIWAKLDNSKAVVVVEKKE